MAVIRTVVELTIHRGTSIAEAAFFMLLAYRTSSHFIQEFQLNYQLKKPPFT